MVSSLSQISRISYPVYAALPEIGSNLAFEIYNLVPEILSELIEHPTFLLSTFAIIMNFASPLKKIEQLHQKFKISDKMVPPPFYTLPF